MSYLPELQNRERGKQVERKARLPAGRSLQSQFSVCRKKFAVSSFQFAGRSLQ
ncbi:MAG: hypothetical protein K0B11_15675 [Mariniphaga sp.]|nr:hypothetical protein [Mariniphaga sp.]